MEKWNIDMSGEKDKKELIQEGDCTAKIVDVELVEKSKSGNPYFLWTLDTEYGISVDMRTTLLKGKRWLLKQTLLACGIESKEDDPQKKYSFDRDDVVGKYIIVHIVHRESTFTGREGNQITTTKAEINGVKKMVTNGIVAKDKDIQF